MNTLLFIGGLGGWEVLLIVSIVLLLFGAKKIPELARGLGSGIKEFKNATLETNKEEKEESTTKSPTKSTTTSQATSTTAPPAEPATATAASTAKPPTSTTTPPVEEQVDGQAEEVNAEEVTEEERKPKHTAS